MLARCAFLAAMLLLSGCKDKEQSMTDCTFEVQKMYPGAEVSPYAILPSQVKDALQLCMKTKGFERDASSTACSMMNVEAQAACYR